jgi:uncharacterized protein YcbX
MPDVARLTVFPVKSLDGITVDATTLGARGAIELDREYAIFDADDNYVNGKATQQIHRLRSSFDPETHELTIGVNRENGEKPSETEEETNAHRDGDDREALNEWLSDFFGEPVTVERDDAGGYPDDTELHGPTVISTGTLREVASWFEGIDTDGMRRRLRANVELGADEPFWEDRLFADHGEVVDFSIGDVALEGVNPCQRCVVPSRDPDTGEEYENFGERFVEQREATLPAWTDSDRFDHYFRLMVNTVVPERSWGSEIAVGDAVTVDGRRQKTEGM